MSNFTLTLSKFTVKLLGMPLKDSCFKDSLLTMLFKDIYKTGLTEKVEGMTYGPNTQTENNVQENIFVSRSSLITINSCYVMQQVGQ